MQSPGAFLNVRSGRVGCVAAGAVGGLLALTLLCGAQEAAPPEPAQPAPPVQTAPPPKPGMFDSIGRFFENGASRFRDHLGGAKRRWDELGDEAAANTKNLNDKAAKAGSAAGENAAAIGKGAADFGKNAAEATKSAVETVGKLSTARVVNGRERCVTAPNGAPDCVAAAEALCRKQGYATGKSMDFTSAEECPTRTLLGQASRDECATVTFISRAMCQ